jgi:hypothetical protein
VSEDSYLKSNFFEQLVEHAFISEVLQEAWYGFGRTVEVLRSEVDASGFDVVLECNEILRHVQLKTSDSIAKTATQKINIALCRKPSGCVIWLRRHEDRGTNRIRLTYLFFGGAPGQPLPSLDGCRIARHTKANSKGFKAERPNIRVVPQDMFTPIATTRELVQRLFGLPEPVRADVADQLSQVTKREGDMEGGR